ncbi:MAG: hypothetical protein AAF772_07645 [Acidobacteriota bacterium]
MRDSSFPSPALPALPGPSPGPPPRLPRPSSPALAIGWPSAETAAAWLWPEDRDRVTAVARWDDAPTDVADWRGVLWYEQHAMEIATDADGAVALPEALPPVPWAALRAAIDPAGGTLMLVVDGPAAAWRRRLIELLAVGFMIQGEAPMPQVIDHPARRALIARLDPYVIRSYRPGDEDAIQAQFRARFHATRSDDDWRWKFLALPADHTGDPAAAAPRITTAWAPDGRLVAHYAGYPMRFRDGDVPRAWPRWLPVPRPARPPVAPPETRDVLHIGDIFTDPSVRGHGRARTGLLARVARHFYAAHCEGRVAFNYGFNTAASRAIALRYCGAARADDVLVWSRTVPRRPLRRVPSVQVRALTGVDDLRPRDGLTPPSWDAFWSRVAVDYGALMVRDAAYVRWRYLTRPDVDYVVLVARRARRWLGWSVFRRAGDRLLWGDALIDPRRPSTAAEALLAAAYAHPALRGAARIEAWFPSRPTWWTSTLRELSFAPAAEPSDLSLTLVPHRLTDAQARLQAAYTTWGDSDLF